MLKQNIPYRWLYTVLVVYLLMGLYWFEPVVQMLIEMRSLDILLFLIMGLFSGSLGFSVTAIVNRLSDNRLKKIWLFMVISLLLSLLCLLVISNQLMKVMTIT